MRQETQHDEQSRAAVRPGTLLVVLTLMFCFIYMDRGMPRSQAVVILNGMSQAPSHRTASMESGERRKTQTALDSKSSLLMHLHLSTWLGWMQGEFGLSNFEDGLLASLFMVGILVGSPLFSQAIYYFNPFRLVGMGTLVWAIAVGLCGFAADFYSMALCRIFVGFGEAAVLAIGPAFIDDNAPRDKVTLWIAILHLAIPCGYALGYVYGTVCVAIFGTWRSTFFVETFIMAPFIIYCFRVPPLTINTGQRSSPEGGAVSALKTLWNDTCLIFSHPAYTVPVLGNCFHVGVLGVLSYWGAKIAEAMFHLDGTDLWIGGLVLLTGTIGILSGGAVVDRLGSSISTTLSFSCLSDLICAFVMAPSFLFIKKFEVFLLPFMVCFTCLFLSMGPLSAESMWSVPLHLRPLATSLSAITIHLLGDMPSAPLFGLLIDLLSDNFDRSDSTAYRLGIGFAAFFLLIAAAIFCIGSEIGKRAKDYRAPVVTIVPEEEDGLSIPMLPNHPCENLR